MFKRIRDFFKRKPKRGPAPPSMVKSTRKVSPLKASSRARLLSGKRSMTKRAAAKSYINNTRNWYNELAKLGVKRGESANRWYKTMRKMKPGRAHVAKVASPVAEKDWWHFSVPKAAVSTKKAAKSTKKAAKSAAKKSASLLKFGKVPSNPFNMFSDRRNKKAAILAKYPKSRAHAIHKYARPGVNPFN